MSDDVRTKGLTIQLLVEMGSLSRRPFFNAIMGAPLKEVSLYTLLSLMTEVFTSMVDALRSAI